MAADVVVSHELKSLRDELAATQRERSAAATVPPAASSPAAAEPVKETPEERALRDQLHDLANEVTSFFEEAEKGISAHPAQSVISALLVGILIGRLLGKR